MKRNLIARQAAGRRQASLTWTETREMISAHPGLVEAMTLWSASDGATSATVLKGPILLEERYVWAVTHNDQEVASGSAKTKEQAQAAAEAAMPNFFQQQDMAGQVSLFAVRRRLVSALRRQASEEPVASNNPDYDPDRGSKVIEGDGETYDTYPFDGDGGKAKPGTGTGAANVASRRRATKGCPVCDEANARPGADVCVTCEAEGRSSAWPKQSRRRTAANETVTYIAKRILSRIEDDYEEAIDWSDDWAQSRAIEGIYDDLAALREATMGFGSEIPDACTRLRDNYNLSTGHGASEDAFITRAGELAERALALPSTIASRRTANITWDNSTFFGGFVMGDNAHCATCGQTMPKGIEAYVRPSSPDDVICRGCAVEIQRDPEGVYKQWKSAASGPAGHWCMFCGQYQSTRNGGGKAAIEHGRQHRALGHEPLTSEEKRKAGQPGTKAWKQTLNKASARTQVPLSDAKVAVLCGDCGQRGGMALGKVTASLRCRCGSANVDLDDSGVPGRKTATADTAELLALTPGHSITFEFTSANGTTVGVEVTVVLKDAPGDRGEYTGLTKGSYLIWEEGTHKVIREIPFGPGQQEWGARAASEFLGDYMFLLTRQSSRRTSSHDSCPDCGIYGCSPTCPGPQGPFDVCPSCGGAKPEGRACTQCSMRAPVDEVGGLDASYLLAARVLATIKRENPDLSEAQARRLAKQAIDLTRG